MREYKHFNTVNAWIVDHPFFMHILSLCMINMHEKRVDYFSRVYGMIFNNQDKLFTDKNGFFFTNLKTNLFFEILHKPEL